MVIPLLEGKSPRQRQMSGRLSRCLTAQGHRRPQPAPRGAGRATARAERCLENRVSRDGGRVQGL
eukprot:12978140-Alexandrium_andersonii.AAC.1